MYWWGNGIILNGLSFSSNKRQLIQKNNVVSNKLQPFSLSWHEAANLAPSKQKKIYLPAADLCIFAENLMRKHPW